MSRKRLQIDIETYSDVDLVNCGVYRYVEGDFHILLFAYAFDDDEVQCVDLACGEQLPQEVVDAIHDSSIIKAAWNAQFERICLSKYFDTQLSPDDWQCSMVWAASLSLPLKLKYAALALKTGEQKDDVGERLIRYFSIPCKPTKSNGGRTRNLPEHAPEDWALFKSYCIQDVRTERDIRYLRAVQSLVELFELSYKLEVERCGVTASAFAFKLADVKVRCKLSPVG